MPVSYVPGNYPLFGIWKGSEESLNDQRDESVARDGTPKQRLAYPSSKKIFKVVHGHLTNADRVTYQSFYAGERANVFNFVWTDGNTYAVVFAASMGDLKFVPDEISQWAVEVVLRQAN